jgi:hypothetical protein
MAETLVANLIDPEVLSDYIDEKLYDNVIFTPLAVQNDELVGAPGDTLSIPKYAYIGDATVIGENGQVTATQLTATKVDKKVQKYAKAVTITDEAALSAFGDPVQEAGDQLTGAISSKIDADIVGVLKDATLEYGVYNSGLTANIVSGALELFGEDQDGTKVLTCSPTDVTNLRQDDNFIKATDIAQQILIEGTIGDIWGCQIVPSNRLKPGTSDKNRKSYIMKPGAIGIVNKRGTQAEQKREADYFRTMYIASKLAIPYLRDDSKCIKIINYTGLDTVGAGVVTSTAGTDATNDTLIAISEAAPLNTKWVYKLGTTDVTPVFGTALSGYTDWTNGTTVIAASTNTKACVALVMASGTDANKPLKYANITLTKKA